MTTCEKCISWQGDSSSYAADCAKNVLTRPPFHATCPEWAPRSVAPMMDMQSNTRMVSGAVLPALVAMDTCLKCHTAGAIYAGGFWSCRGCGWCWQ